MTSKDDLFEVIDAAALIINATGKILEDGRIDWTDIPRVMGDLLAMPGAIARATDNIQSITWNQFVSEQDTAEILDYFKSKVDIPQDVTEARIERGLHGLLEFAGLAADIIKRGDS